ncbi:hypothetical protein L7E55_17025 [Pelotomaculum isophthalicicum JI]|uniref:Uncharacterized protein n=1 Tax=Pelotomaculum isophthalicicum JI TaxID=947010 RepID=A0A9X4H7G2_9FIRM|nr:hypothetical protein [Pelotomaculum isophthalicicum]MDF9410022.1 hypothetical protein [Pelotomaculum isophthalicicum JI]
MSGVTFLTCLADWQNNSHAIDGENPTVKLREKQQDLDKIKETIEDQGYDVK